MDPNNFIVNLKLLMKQLTVNNNKLIQHITEVADIGYEKANEVVKVITNSDTPDGLLKLYLIDCIIKRIGGSYIALFSEELVDSFRKVFLTADIQCRCKLFSLRNTWENVVSESTLMHLDNTIHKIDAEWPLQLKEVKTNENVLDNPIIEDGAKPERKYETKCEGSAKNSDDSDHAGGVTSCHGLSQSVIKTEVRSIPRQPSSLDNDDIVWLNTVNRFGAEQLTFGGSQGVIQKRVETRKNSNGDLWEDLDHNDIPPTQQLIKNAIVSSDNRKKRGIKWIHTNYTYTMSDEIFDEVYNVELRTTNHAEFFNRKDSIAIEIDKIFKGCCIYVDKASPCIKYWKLRAYCNHTNCRRYCLTASHENPKHFSIEIDKMEICHKGTVTKQLRRYERDQKIAVSAEMRPKDVRNADLMKVDVETRIAGNYEDVKSLCVYEKVREKALKRQDNCLDDIDDVESMWSDDPKTNFISNTLSRNRFAVYITSKKQHDVLHKFHLLRLIYGIQIVARMDASGNIARDIEAGCLLYWALTINIRILTDEKITPLALGEQFNINNKSRHIAAWLFDFALSHASFYEDHPLILDWMITDFSYANFHAILKSLTNISLKEYLNLTRKWIIHKMTYGEFPEDFYRMVKIKMCFTHLMHTFALMTKRLYGKDKNKELPHCRIVLEILATMIQCRDYTLLTTCWEQLVILLKNEYVNDDVENAVAQIDKIKKADINLDNYSEDQLLTAVEVENLQEYDHTLYESNLFYHEFAQISDNVKVYRYDKNAKENVYY